MAFTQADLDSIDRAIASGELSITHSGRTVTYRSMADLLKARDRIANQISASASPARRGTYRYTFHTLRDE